MRPRHHVIAVTSELDDFKDEVRRIFGELERSGAGSLAGECSPSLDVYETDDTIEITVDVPGVDAAAVRVLGKGDMLFLPPASSRFIRVHAPYISEQESARLASFLRKQGKPVYDASITAEEKSMLDGIEMDKDDLYDEAARIVVSSGQASISYLQRKLRIGFSRAARLVDMMEMEGLVSPPDAGKVREVLVDKGYFEEVDAQLR